MIPAGEPDAEAKPRQILIISADIGEGHDLPARAVAREFKDEDPDAQISVVNGLPAMGPVLTKVLRENSQFMFQWLPWLFDFQYMLFMYFAPTRWLAKRLLTAFGRRGLMRLIRAHDPDLIVSTYPGVTAVLGELRRKGKLKVPCYSSITDLAGLRFWAHPGIDLHFVTHPESMEEVEKIAGPGSVRWAKPPTSPAFLAARSRADARRSLGLPADAKVIGVSGGGWGVGDLIGATRVALAEPDAIVLCLCGRNDKLRAKVTKRFGEDPRLRVMGFTDRMGDVLAAVDALIHSSAGLTVLEAIIRGCPVVSYGFGVGPRPRQQPGARALRPRPGRQLGVGARSGSGPRAGEPSRAERLVRAPALDGLADPQRRATHAAAARLAAAHRACGHGRGGGAGHRRLDVDHRRLVHARLALRAHASDHHGGYHASRGRRADRCTQPAQVGGLASTTGRQRNSRLVCAWRLGALDGLSAARLRRPGGPEAAQRRSRPLAGTRRTSSTTCCTQRVAGRHFLYTSSGPSVGQWWLAHGAGGRLIAGAVRLDDHGDTVGHLHPGEVIELTRLER